MDELVEAYNRECAAVYGAVFRFTKMESGKCSASQTKIGKRIGLKRPAVNKYIQILIKDGYILDETPDVKNKPHVYSLLIMPTIGIDMGVFQKNTDDGNGVSEENTTGVSQEDAKIPSTKIEDQEDRKEEAPKRKRTPLDDMTDAICEVCQVDIDTAAPSVIKIRTVLVKAKYTAEDIIAFGKWWDSDSWRRAHPPTIWQLKERIGIIRPRKPKPIPQGNVKQRLKEREG